VLEENYAVKQVPPKSLGEEMEFFRQYNEILFKKLEKKMSDLEIAYQELKLLEERYRLSFENMSDIIYVNDADLNIISISPSLESVLGYKPEDFIGRPVSALSSLFAPESFEQVIADIGLVLQGNTIHATVYRFIARDGSFKYGEVSGSPLIRDGKIIGIISIARDITDRKRAEEELQRTLESLRKAVGATIQVMVSAVEARDPYTAGHQVRVADLARAIATEMGLSREQTEGIRMAGSRHDIGKLSIPAEILSKPTKLTNNEFSLIKEHPRKGYEILKDVESPWPLAEIVYQHHERTDGSGYPRKLKGDEILIEARIMAVADVVEAMSSHRPYRPGKGIDAALEEIEKNRGTLYDDAVVDACLILFREKGFQIAGT
jgi:PAS domain S-box-containing protein